MGSCSTVDVLNLRPDCTVSIARGDSAECRLLPCGNLLDEPMDPRLFLDLPVYSGFPFFGPFEAQSFWDVVKDVRDGASMGRGIGAITSSDIHERIRQQDVVKVFRTRHFNEPRRPGWGWSASRPCYRRSF